MKPERFDQAEVDKARVRAIMALLVSAVESGERKVPVKHLWFKKPSIRSRELRDGNPPANSDRPKHLRGLYLVVDVGDIPDEVIAAVKKQRKKAKRMHSDPTRIIDVVTDAGPEIERAMRRGTLFKR